VWTSPFSAPIDSSCSVRPGRGKSTLLKAVGGYMAPVEGEIVLKGARVSRPGPDRMMVFQEFDQLLPWKTVRQNVLFALETSGRLRGRAAHDKAMQYIEKVHLTRFADPIRTRCPGE
jgi:NitT/TauT family transport system ATP-binding protein